MQSHLNLSKCKSIGHTPLKPIKQTLKVTKQDNDADNQSTFNKMLPLKFRNILRVQKLSWDHFKGKVDPKSDWLAHIYWNINYKLSNDPKPKLSVNIEVSPRSWVREGCKHQYLLNHEHGHLLIGYLCALQFIRRIQSSKIQIFNQHVSNVFSRTPKQYQRMQRLYDCETQHCMNDKMQQKWNNLIKQKLLFYKSVLSQKEGQIEKSQNVWKKINGK